MATDSATKKITKHRKPRIHITYDVETGNAKEKKELPFVVGAMGDYSGNAPSKEKKPLKERSFVNIHSGNLDDVMEKIGPGVRFRVNNELGDDVEGQEMQVELKFNKMEDFEPMNVAKQVPALKALFDARQQLEEILSKADLSQNLETILEDVLQNNEKLQELMNQLGGDKAEAKAEEVKE
jgi:type VI secretion system protein ImpB